MTSSTWADVLLVAVVLAPLATAVLGFAGAAPNVDARWTTGGCVIAAAGAIVLLVAGQHPHVSRLAPDDLALAAAAASAVLALGGRSAVRTPLIATIVTCVICGIVSGAPGDPSTVGPVLGLAAGVALVAFLRDAGRPTIGALSIGVVVIAAGARAGGNGGSVAVIVGAALAGIASSVSPRRAATVLLPIALLLGLRVGPTLAGTSTARWLAVVLGVAGAGLALLPAVVPACARSARCAALVPWTLAAAIGPLAGTPVAARALAAGTVIALVLGGPLALLAAAPGAAVFVYAVADGNGWARPVIALLLAATVLGLTSGQAQETTPARLRIVDALALALGVWFVVLPESWGWTRVEALRAYSDGTALAGAVASIVAVLVAIRAGGVTADPFLPWILTSEEETAAPSARLDVVMVTVVVVMGLLAAALVRSPGL